jgi:predicted amidohydrolase
MKICAAQMKSVKGDIKKNIELHKKMIGLAALHGVQLVVFPELSLTGYEPDLAKNLATSSEDVRLNEIQKMSDVNLVTIAAGLPIESSGGVLIGMVVFQPGKPRQTYFKQHLHSDELPYFISGHDDLLLTFDELKIAPAICYESLLSEHSDKAARNGADIYFASVAKAPGGVGKAYAHMPQVAKKHAMVVMMANSVGPSDNFIGAGKSSVWRTDGSLVEALDETSDGLLIFDTKTKVAKKIYL